MLPHEVWVLTFEYDILHPLKKLAQMPGVNGLPMLQSMFPVF